MPSAAASLRTWRALLQSATECPYVGPRPQNSKDVNMLVGRGDDVRRISRAVTNRSLVVLDGYSGAGKSSLLQNGLFARLREAEFAVLVCRMWSRTSEDFDHSARAVEKYLARGIERTHALEPGPGPVPDDLLLDVLVRDGGLRDTLDKNYRETGVVVILDQFEELLRQHSRLATSVVQWVIDTGHRSGSIRVVLSLRTDTLHLLDPLLRGIRPFSMDRVRIDELSDLKQIEDIIRTFRHERGVVGPALDESNVTSKGNLRGVAPEVVERLLAAWSEADVTPKLLDLQATLYALYYRARRRGESALSDAPGSAQAFSIELVDLESLLNDAYRSPREGTRLSPFTMGLREAMSLKIRHSEQAAYGAGLDRYLVTGAREAVRRICPLLSSGNFKIPIREPDLARQVLTPELRVLREDLLRETGQESPQPADVYHAVGALLFELRREDDFLSVRPEAVPSLTQYFPGSKAPESHSEETARIVDVTAGPMMWASASATVFEELRRVAFAIEWLEATEIVRRDPDGTLLLVHDGAGMALNVLSDNHGADPEVALRQLTGSRGERFSWPDRQLGGNRAWEVIANLNWRDCTITTNFQRIVFVNCDFRGTRFLGCRLEGVTFVNCLLDDANFEYCSVVGELDPSRIARSAASLEEGRQKVRLAPSFTVGADRREIQAYLAYRGEEEGGEACFFSDTSGVPARPGGPPAGHAGELLAHLSISDEPAPFTSEPPVRATPRAGGVAMISGRVCFLTLYRCTSEDGGGFSFHHVSGEGLSVIDQHGGRIDIHDGALRGISISQDQVEGRTDPAKGAPRVELTVHDSLVSNIYFSGDMCGRAAFDNSVVLMLLNAGENSQSGFRVAINDCRHLCLVNTDDPTEGVEDTEMDEQVRYFAPVSGSRFSAPNRPALAHDLEAMDFRYNPQAWEARQRSRGGRL